MDLNQYGEIIKSIWESLPSRFPVKFDAFQIMPNHIHFIIIIERTHDNLMDRAHRDAPLQKRSLLSQIVGYFKMNSSKLIHNVGAIHESPVLIKQKQIFQRNFYEHIIRNEKEYFKIRRYIQTNPRNWGEDKYFV